MTIATRDNIKAKPLILLGLKASSTLTIRNNAFDVLIFSFLYSIYTLINKVIDDTSPTNIRTTPINTDNVIPLSLITFYLLVVPNPY
jgi:hypothetical protein